MSDNALTILGSSSALPTSQRFPTAQVLQMLGRFFLIDCGEGTQMQLRKSSISFERIRSIFISHLHGDHYLGIFGVLSTFNLLGRKTPLTIFAPKGFEKIVRFQMQYLEPQMSYKIEFIDLPNDEPFSLIYSDKKIEVFSIKLKHRIPCWGFYFKQRNVELKINKDAIEKYHLTIPQIVSIKNGGNLITSENKTIENSELTTSEIPFSYAFISDTKFLPEIAHYIKGVRLLYHEATFASNLLQRAIDTYHCTSIQAAQFAEIVSAEKLIIGHFSARYKNIDILVDEAKEIFLNTVPAEDLKTYIL